jgi:lysophospholipid acyltransferase (LPLAT)-like uncharacterized protein
MSRGWKPWKRYREHPLLLLLLPRVGTLLLRCLFRSLRVSCVGRELFDHLVTQEGRQVVAAFWHGRLLMMPFAYPKIPWAIMVSHHPDGEYITRVAERFGIRVIRGSSRRGGRSALLGMVRAYRQGCHLAITPDGPTGPREEVKPGTIDLARLTGAPIVPAAFGASRGRFLRSWDRFFIPYPFGRMVFVYGEPLWLRPDAGPEDLEKARVLLEERLRQVTAQADAYFGKG